MEQASAFEVVITAFFSAQFGKDRNACTISHSYGLFTEINSQTLSTKEFRDYRDKLKAILKLSRFSAGFPSMRDNERSGRGLHIHYREAHARQDDSWGYQDNSKAGHNVLYFNLPFLP